VQSRRLSNDPYAVVQEATRRHRAEHGCGAYTYSDGRLLGVLSAAVGARRVIEVGTALGYTALWLGHAGAHVDTVEADAEHVRLARNVIAGYGAEERIVVHAGNAGDVLDELEFGAYDLAFFDGFAPTTELLNQLHKLVRPAGTLVCANLQLTDDESVRRELDDPGRWLTARWGENALAIRTSGGT